jgi:hypothetical protein
MSGGEARECRHACNQLLPWYLNGSLETGERARVESHLQACPVCRRELEVLADLSRAMSFRHQGAIESRAASKSGKAAVPATFGWAIAASIVLLSLLGLVAYLRRVSEPAPAAAPAASETAVLDLGSGPARNADSRAELRIEGTTHRVDVSFLPPIDGRNDYELRLVGPEHEELQSWGRGPLALDRLGRARVSIEASRFYRAGDYHLLVRLLGSAGEIREHAFPFTVAFVPPR